MIEDDYYYAQYQHPLLHLGRIWQDWLSDFQNINPRIAGIFGRIFISLPTVIFDLLNSVIFFLLARVIAVYITHNSHPNLAKVNVSSFCLLALFLPSIWTDSYFWASGAVNYTWQVTLLLYFFLPFYRHLFVPTLNNHFWIFLPFAFIVGMTNENASLSLIVATVLSYFTFQLKVGRNISFILSLMLLGAGNWLLIKAPAQSVRLQSDSFDFYWSETFLDKIIRSSNNLFYTFAYHPYLMAVSLLTLALLVLSRTSKISFKQFFPDKGTIFWFIAAMTATMAFFFSPIYLYRNRKMFVIAIFLFIAVAKWSYQIYPLLSKRNTYWVKGVIVLFFFFNVSLMALAFKQLKRTHRQTVEHIQESKQNENLTVFVRDYHKQNFLAYFVLVRAEFLSRDSIHWKNTLMAKYYGITEIVVAHQARDASIEQEQE